MAVEKYVIPVVICDEDWLLLTGQKETLTRQQREDQGHRARSGSVVRIKPGQLLVIDVYTEWSGPCSAVESHLRRLRHSFVEAPDTLALARACCDHITDLQAFKHDIRPTFLFWARGRPVALLRGANRPLLTRLINEEVNIEANHRERKLIDIDYCSDKVIQCEHDLANLEADEVVRSIGRGNTDRLSAVFNVVETRRKSPSGVADENEQDGGATAASEMNGDENFGENIFGQNTNEEEEEGSDEGQTNRKTSDDQDESSDLGDSCQQEDEEDYEEEFSNNSDDDYDDDEKVQVIDGQKLNEQTVDGHYDAGEALGNPFGKKRRKKKKKMETNLLKEILDFKPVKRFSH